MTFNHNIFNTLSRSDVTKFLEAFGITEYDLGIFSKAVTYDVNTKLDELLQACSSDDDLEYVQVSVTIIFHSWKLEYALDSVNAQLESNSNTFYVSQDTSAEQMAEYILSAVAQISGLGTYQAKHISTPVKEPDWALVEQF